MRNKKKMELDVDFIGGQEPLTKEEQQAISDYLKQRKEKKAQIKSAEGKVLQVSRHRGSAAI